MNILDRIRLRSQPKDSVLPAEVDQYYQAENDNRRGVAFLLGIITLVITLVLASLLFVAGRFVYRKIANNDKPTTTQTQTTKKSDTKETKSTSGTASSGNSNSSTNNSGSSSSSTPNSSTPASGSSSANPPATATTPNTGDQPTEVLPNTGDGLE